MAIEAVNTYAQTHSSSTANPLKAKLYGNTTSAIYSMEFVDGSPVRPVSPTSNKTNGHLPERLLNDTNGTFDASKSARSPHSIIKPLELNDGLGDLRSAGRSSTNIPPLDTFQQPPSSPNRTTNRHRRAQSASNSSSPVVISPDLRYGPGLSSSRLAVNTTQETSSIRPVHPGAEQLVHRHTLQVPKASGVRGSRDFSFQAGNASEDAISSGVAYGGRRASMTLGRRVTRSVNSELFLDEAHQDPDALRWAESVRQKRASRRKRKEEEEDDRVMVGTKVDENHVNWVTAYNMLTGIRFTVSRTNAKLDRDLTDADFDAKHKFSFDITGNELTPSAKYDFKFKDYAPWVFRHLRTTFRLDPADYLISLTSKYILSELGSPGKSGSFFYFSRDYKYIIKTIHHAEHKLLRKILRDYYDHVQQNPNTLISQFYGLHRVKIPYGRKIHFVVMNNLFPPHRDIHETFDLKGSTVGREFKEEELGKNPRATLKDLNWLRRNNHLEFGPVKKQLFVQQMQRDVALLQKLKIMDYSLLVGIHDLTRGNDERLRDKTLQVFQPGADREAEPAPNMLIRTPSKLETAQKARELRQLIKKERPIPMDQSTFKMPEEVIEGRANSVFYGDDGGFRATHENGDPGEEIYYLGIIDCLTHYGFVKRLEHFWKGLTESKTQISPIPPEGYGNRFIKFISNITMPREQAEAEAEAEARASNGTAIITDLGGHHISTEIGDLRSDSRIARLSENQLMEKAERQVQKSGSSDDERPDARTLTTTKSPPTQKDDRNGFILPVVDETSEAGGSGAPNSEQPQYRASNQNLSPPLGGQPPPTPPSPPRDMASNGSLLKTDIPILPMPRFSNSPLPMSPLNGPIQDEP